MISNAGLIKLISFHTFFNILLFAAKRKTDKCTYNILKVQNNSLKDQKF